jgi:hypothetical protein
MIWRLLKRERKFEEEEEIILPPFDVTLLL